MIPPSFLLDTDSHGRPDFPMAPHAPFGSPKPMGGVACDTVRHAEHTRAVSRKKKTRLPHAQWSGISWTRVDRRSPRRRRRIASISCETLACTSEQNKKETYQR